MAFRAGHHTVLILSGCLAVTGCSQSTQPRATPESGLLFFTDFEMPTDSVGWEAQGGIALYRDSLKAEGQQCLFVEGTDVFPHAQRIIDTLADSTDIILRFEARCPGRRGGAVILGTQAGLRGDAWVSVNDSLWGWYVDTARMPAGTILNVSIVGNGQIGTPILVDNIEVRRIVLR